MEGVGTFPNIWEVATCEGEYTWVVSARENTLGLFLLGKTFATNLLLIYRIETTIVKKKM